MTLGTALYLLGWALSIAFTYQILRERRPPAATVAWIAFVFLLPVLGIVIYLLIGARKLKRPRRQRVRPHFEHDRQIPLEQAQPLDQLLRRLGSSGATADNRVSLLIEAKAAREALIALIDSAERMVYVLIYTFYEDASGQAVLSALTRAVDRGVEVRLMIDDIGSANLKSRQMRAFQQASGRMIRFKPVWYALAKRVANLRNHRKIVVADAQRAWFGGRNIGDEYLADGADQGKWIDLSVSVEGSAARALEAICAADWAFGTDTQVSRAPHAAVPMVDTSEPRRLVQVLASGPDQREDVWHTAFIKACFEARERLWMVTPYFVPDDAAFGAISTAARSGVDVRLVIPARTDSLLVDTVGASYLRDLQRLNVQVYRFTPGMAHAKLVIVDSSFAILGSGNLDARSFFLNYEVMGVIYDADINEQLAQFFLKLQARSKLGFRSVRATTELLASTLRILSPML